jgi:dUTP pyrophosphatase
MKLLIKRLSNNAIIPTRASPGSVGYDLYSTIDMYIPPMERGIVNTGIVLASP